MREFSFLIVAGGSGSRIGGLEKQFRLLGGKPLWMWSAELAESMCGTCIRGACVREIVLVLPSGQRETSAHFSLPFRVVSGGPTRPDSVRNGLLACTREGVMVHDAARPFASPRLLATLMEKTSETTGAVPVLPLTEAIKRIEDGRTSAVDREGLYATQTPQSFFRDALIRVLGEQVAAVRDEAEAWLAAGLDLCCVEGERLNFKVTWPEDLRLASALVAKGGIKDRREMADQNKADQNKMEDTEAMENMEKMGKNPQIGEVRTGIGYDVHRLTPGRPLVLGGVRIESPLGLLGHSDADVLAHAVADAVLGAAGLPDIGNLFPADDEKYRGADSMELLREAANMAMREGWDVVWVDAVIEAQVPRLNARLPEMAERLSALLGPKLLDPKSPRAGCVNLKAKSPEKTGDPGAARSMVCRAVATLRRRLPE
ncbi:MAG: 2-C-methyl-D-erythritol 2,4-cyclodiphosphate synthase [Synergistaceae bacterium]|jgi:2-C-methyl-D-erythritol 4-phosphate cytidylyltransferase/2-C-methyl-D-erythritol 2,4-cyclodiphosphate synthase|nr:2-C-methyl-D-erythritol 2,4-cyclodiphosphate synthase [Synergistaceae bacterium]